MSAGGFGRAFGPPRERAADPPAEGSRGRAGGSIATLRRHAMAKSAINMVSRSSCRGDFRDFGDCNHRPTADIATHRLLVFGFRHFHL